MATKTVVETCSSCRGSGFTNSSTYREPEPDHGCRDCGGDGYDAPRLGRKMRKGSGKVKITCEKREDGWLEVKREPKTGWF